MSWQFLQLTGAAFLCSGLRQPSLYFRCCSSFFWRGTRQRDVAGFPPAAATTLRLAAPLDDTRLPSSSRIWQFRFPSRLARATGGRRTNSIRTFATVLVNGS